MNRAVDNGWYADGLFVCFVGEDKLCEGLQAHSLVQGLSLRITGALEAQRGGSVIPKFSTIKNIDFFSPRYT